MDIRLEPRTAAHPKREEIERLHETMKKRELGRKRRRLWSRFRRQSGGVGIGDPSAFVSTFHCVYAIRGIVLDGDESDSEAADA